MKPISQKLDFGCNQTPQMFGELVPLLHLPPDEDAPPLPDIQPKVNQQMLFALVNS
jgi:hypothetical protein